MLEFVKVDHTYYHAHACFGTKVVKYIPHTTDLDKYVNTVVSKECHDEYELLYKIFRSGVDQLPDHSAIIGCFILDETDY